MTFIISSRAVRRGIASLTVLAGALCVSAEAQACSLVWDERLAYRTNDAVVWGTYVPGDARGEGTIEVSRRLKGSRERVLRIRWDADWVDEGANCPVWQPDPEHPKGRFFLVASDDGTSFSVSAQIPMQKTR